MGGLVAFTKEDDSEKEAVWLPELPILEYLNSTKKDAVVGVRLPGELRKILEREALISGEKVGGHATKILASHVGIQRIQKLHRLQLARGRRNEAA